MNIMLTREETQAIRDHLALLLATNSQFRSAQPLIEAFAHFDEALRATR